MTNSKTILAAALLGVALVSAPAFAQDASSIVPAVPSSAAAEAASPSAEATATAVAEPEEPVVKQHWSFAGPFGTFDRNQLQRGFQVFKEVCSNCHSARLLAFRNLSEPGGPEFSEAQVKALAATYQIDDPDAEGGKRAGLPSDHWPSPFPTEKDARDANGGALPPDMSVLAKARGIEDKFPDWVFNFFTTYAEGGPDYIHAVLNGYADAPAGFTLPDGKYYNKVFPGHSIGMPPPLSDGQVQYEPGEDGSTVPLTVDQYSKDVASFLMWMAEPHLDANKTAGFRVITFLILFAVLMWMVKNRLWSRVEH
jgi:ubiquinol-cytochrome c reductase cytochrome c1 subunit